MIKKFKIFGKRYVSEIDVDFVIIWVDGGDSQWLKEKAKYSFNNTPETSIDESASRYRDWDNLQYWFRGVEEYTPWVRKIHFVTAGHVPEWLDLDNPKLNFVKHDDYIPKQYLPTFSSHPIELNLHRINGLAEHFVYFNDDMFITKPMKKTDFFVNGLPCDQAQLSRTVSTDNNTIMPHIILNNIGFLNRYFDKDYVIKKNWARWFSYRYSVISNLRNLMLLPYPYFPGFSWNHLPSAFLKSTFDEVWRKDPYTLSRVSSNKFRNIEDVSQYVMKEWQIAKGNFYPKNMFGKIGRVFTDITIQTEDACHAIEKQKYSMLCLNDQNSNDDISLKKNSIKASFEKILPNKSSFEKKDSNV